MAYRVIEPVADPARIIPLGVALRSCNTPIYTTTDQAFENLKTLLLTRKGERILQPTFGTYLLDILFEPNVSRIKERINDIITEPITQWLPYIDINDISIITADDNPDLTYNIEITISFSVSGYDGRTITFRMDDNGVLEIV